MALPTYYSTGTVSVNNGATTVTGSGTGWGGDVLLPGDLFMDPAQPEIPPQRIASIIDATHLELAVGWPGDDVTADPYEVRFIGIVERSTAQTRRLLEQLSVVQAHGRGLFFRFSDGTADSDPGAGYLRFDSAAIPSATAAYIDNLDADGASVSALIDTWGDSTSPAKGQLWVRKISDPAVFHVFGVSGAVVDGAGYRKLMLAHVGGSGSLLADDELMVFFAQTGDAADSFPGVDGDDAWTPILVIDYDGARSVLRVYDWFGGSGPTPVPAGWYVGAAGYVEGIEDAASVGAGGFSYDAVNDRIGIGIATPDGKVEINKNTGNTQALTNSTNTLLHLVGTNTQRAQLASDAFGNDAAWIFRRANGTLGAETAVQSGQLIGTLLGYVYGATGYSPASRGSVRFVAEEDMDDDKQGVRVELWGTAAGTTTAVKGLVLKGDGTLLLASKTLDGAAQVGALEYDGRALFWTAVASSRQVVAAHQITTLTADRNGSNGTAAQEIFGATEDTLTVAASTSYRFRCQFAITRSAGTTSHTTGFLLGGTATFTSIDALAKVSNPTGNVLGTVSEIQVTAATETVLTAANTSATENVRVTVEGIMRINGAGTIVPQFKYSAAPGGTPAVKRNAFFELWPIGSDTVAAVGNWS